MCNSRILISKTFFLPILTNLVRQFMIIRLPVMKMKTAWKISSVCFLKTKKLTFLSISTIKKMQNNHPKTSI